MLFNVPFIPGENNSAGVSKIAHGVSSKTQVSAAAPSSQSSHADAICFGGKEPNESCSTSFGAPDVHGCRRMEISTSEWLFKGKRKCRSRKMGIDRMAEKYKAGMDHGRLLPGSSQNMDLSRIHGSLITDCDGYLVKSRSIREIQTAEHLGWNWNLHRRESHERLPHRHSRFMLNPKYDSGEFSFTCAGVSEIGHGASSNTQVSAAAPSSQSSHAEPNESYSTSCGAPDVPSGSRRMEIGTSEWRLKGKRNCRPRKMGVDGKAETYKAGMDRGRLLPGSSQNMDLSRIHGSLIIDCDGYLVKSRSIREIQTSEQLGWNWNVHHRESNEKGSFAEMAAPKRQLPHRHSSFMLNPMYDSGELYDVTVRVEANNRPQGVPFISLVSKIYGPAVTGHPITVEVLDDGSCDDQLAVSRLCSSSSEMESKFGGASCAQGGDVVYGRRPRGRLLPGSSQNMDLSRIHGSLITDCDGYLVKSRSIREIQTAEHLGWNWNLHRRESHERLPHRHSRFMLNPKYDSGEFSFTCAGVSEIGHGASSNTQVSAAAPSSQSSHAEPNESYSTSCGAPDVPSGSRRMEIGTSEWRLKGKRNCRPRKMGVDGKAETYKAGMDRGRLLPGSSQNMDLSRIHGSLIIDCDGYLVKSRSIREIQTSEQLGWNWNVHHRESNEKGSFAEMAAPKRQLPHRHSSFMLNPMYDSGELYDVTVRVEANNRPQGVPFISLVSKIYGPAVTGHPITVEVLDDGSCDDQLAVSRLCSSSSEMESKFGGASCAQGGDVVYGRRPRGRLLPGSSQNMDLSRIHGSLITDCDGYLVKSRSIREIQTAEHLGWNWNLHRRESHERLPHRHSRFMLNPKYDSGEFSFSHHVGSPGFYDVTVRVEANNRPQGVLYISLASKIYSRHVTGHPLTVEVLDDGSCDNLLAVSRLYSSSLDTDNKFGGAYCAQGGDVVYGRRPRGRPPRNDNWSQGHCSLAKPERKGHSPKKFRKLSSLTDSYGKNHNQEFEPLCGFCAISFSLQ